MREDGLSTVGTVLKPSEIRYIVTRDIPVASQTIELPPHPMLSASEAAQIRLAHSDK